MYRAARSLIYSSARRITSITGWTAWNVEMLRAGDVDAAFVRGEVGATGIEVILCGTEELAAVLPVGHPLSGEHSVTVDQIRRQPVVLRPPKPGRNTTTR